MTANEGPSGYAAWRLIAEELRVDVTDGRIPVGGRLPSEAELAERFAVNRHTVRRAVAALAAEGLVEARRGSGTFVAPHTLVTHRIGTRTRMTDSLGPRSGDASARLLETAIEVPPPDVAAVLGEQVVRLEVVRSLSGRPISRGTHWFGLGRAPDLAAHFRRTGSITRSLEAGGIDDYVRVSTTISARHATADELSDLELSPGAVVLVARALDALPGGEPLSVGYTRFPAHLVELDVEHVPTA
ncbi:phosphonate metabolism transcriptional regulator PhnF [Cryptosporangium phraense]|uniref:Phosphonate metabolism transcriptional regulator PhnF n=1 Tax=Cryptosporangium phraense TaxID=2593070 RepID=A0A545AN52_9ACTN|nr:phosphonate metabolism transcriptional regulator PhnF [Cryptosporangium phraense]